MLQRIIAITFHAAVMLIAAAVAVWLTITGHTLHIGGLLLALGGVLGAVMFGLRLAEGFGPDQISIWAGPISAVRPGITLHSTNLSRRRVTSNPKSGSAPSALPPR